MKEGIIISTSIDPEDWDHYVKNHPYGNIFQTQSMAAVWNQTKRRETLSLAALDDARKIIAVLQAVIIKERTDILGNFLARAVIHGGPLYLNTDKGQNAAIVLLKEYDKICQKRALYSEIRNFWDTSSTNSLFMQSGYQYEEHLNYLIDLDKSEDELWKGIHKARKKNINRATKYGVIVEEFNNKNMIPIFYKLLQETYNNVKIPLADISFFESAFKHLASKNMVKFFLARSEDRFIGARAVLTYKNFVHDWYAGASNDALSLYPNDILVWHILKWGIENHYKVFDFGGAGKPDVEYGPREFKRRFGGELVNYGRYSRVYSPIKLKIAENGYGFYKRLSGKC
jgi:serine/alanine adding enzyme